jgi:hypothetical protein
VTHLDETPNYARSDEARSTDDKDAHATAHSLLRLR